LGTVNAEEYAPGRDHKATALTNAVTEGHDTMTTPNENTTGAYKREIARLIALAVQSGDTDAYSGKRGTTRITNGLQLEVTTDPNNPSAAWAVIMHDVSEDGVAFWSKRDLSPRTLIYIRQFSPDKIRPWIPASVKHKTVGLRGNLVGAEFDISRSAGSAPGPGACGRPSSRPLQPAGLGRRGFPR